MHAGVEVLTGYLLVVDPGPLHTSFPEDECGNETTFTLSAVSVGTEPVTLSFSCTYYTHRMPPGVSSEQGLWVSPLNLGP